MENRTPETVCWTSNLCNQGWRCWLALNKFLHRAIRAVIDTVFHVDISEVNYATCRYIIDNILTHFPFQITYDSIQALTYIWQTHVWKNNLGVKTVKIIDCLDLFRGKISCIFRHGCLKWLFIDFFSKMSHFISQKSWKLVANNQIY